MTSPLRRKRPTTAHGTSWRATTAASLLGLGVWLGGPAAAQDHRPAALTDTLPAAPANVTTLPPVLPNLAQPTPPVPDSVHQAPAQLPPPASPRPASLHFSREPAQPTPPTQYVAPFTPPALPVTPAAGALGTVQVSPAYTGPVAAPTTQPAYTSQGVGGAPLSARQRRVVEESLDYSIQLNIPSIYRLTQLESEAAFKERLRNEFRLRGDRIVFPEEPPLSTEPYQGRHWPPVVETVEPAYVCHGRLYFEQINSERLGWSVGALQPVVSGLHFYWDVFLLPYHLATQPCEHIECSAGKCLPGDAAPLALYPPQLSVTGLLAQTAAVSAGFFIFP